MSGGFHLRIIRFLFQKSYSYSVIAMKVIHPIIKTGSSLLLLGRSNNFLRQCPFHSKVSTILTRLFRVYYSSRLVFDHRPLVDNVRNEPLPGEVETDFSQPGNERSVWNWIWFHDGSRDDEKGYREERERRRRGGKRGPVQRLPGQEVSLFPSNDLHFRCPAFRLVLQVSSSRGNEKADQRAAAFPFFRRTSSSGGSLLRENLHRFLEQHHRRNVCPSRYRFTDSPIEEWTSENFEEIEFEIEFTSGSYHVYYLRPIGKTIDRSLEKFKRNN